MCVTHSNTRLSIFNQISKSANFAKFRPVCGFSSSPTKHHML